MREMCLASLRLFFQVLLRVSSPTSTRPAALWKGRLSMMKKFAGASSVPPCCLRFHAYGWIVFLSRTSILTALNPAWLKLGVGKAGSTMLDMSTSSTTTTGLLLARLASLSMTLWLGNVDHVDSRSLSGR
ncbi:hypothetical protein CEE58_17675 [Stenotrophomonas maltophilia]|nr:hypothetical protein CEE58_17675 [Stenotrophomonas maltophilia]